MKILFADDHEMVREGFRAFVEMARPELELVEADSLEGAIDAVRKLDSAPDLAILDLRMPGMNGLDGIDRFRAACPHVPLAIISAYVRRLYQQGAIERGARGFIPKSLEAPDLLAAIETILDGQTFLPPPRGRTASGERSGGAAGSSSPLDLLTAREQDVLTLLCGGSANKDIARRLELQEVTVKVHLRGVFRKLGAQNRTQAVQIARELGWQS
ncbi:response regulator [Oceanibacterium hippocampi]|uniref:Transcriptional regulatory protein DegU n=1 Tax=Oceanibacterium hippocampi TaxID=745714 RepID=A0A1Y5SWJ8_9PROT|nr:response regulator transcription factor [Oceanibacterium hippocampi]SLN50092.1 Transcriptional regulatory protein DegU [Oceanibacterium hippocampi]